MMFITTNLQTLDWSEISVTPKDFFIRIMRQSIISKTKHHTGLTCSHTTSYKTKNTTTIQIMNMTTTKYPLCMNLTFRQPFPFIIIIHQKITFSNRSSERTKELIRYVGVYKNINMKLKKQDISIPSIEPAEITKENIPKHIIPPKTINTSMNTLTTTNITETNNQRTNPDVKPPSIIQYLLPNYL